MVEHADGAGHFALAMDEAQGRNRLDAEILGDLALLVGVHLGEADMRLEFRDERFEDRRHGLAGADQSAQKSISSGGPSSMTCALNFSTVRWSG